MERSIRVPIADIQYGSLPILGFFRGLLSSARLTEAR